MANIAAKSKLPHLGTAARAMILGMVYAMREGQNPTKWPEAWNKDLKVANELKKLFSSYK